MEGDDEFPFEGVTTGILSSLSIVISGAIGDIEEVVRTGLLVGLEGLVQGDGFESSSSPKHSMTTLSLEH